MTIRREFRLMRIATKYRKDPVDATTRPLLFVLCGAAQELAESNSYEQELASSRRITAKTNAFVEQLKQFGGVVTVVVVFASVVHMSNLPITEPGVR
jgi:hypothetical protein